MHKFRRDVIAGVSSASDAALFGGEILSRKANPELMGNSTRRPNAVAADGRSRSHD